MKNSFTLPSKIELYWFSGTGNSLTIALKTQDILTKKGLTVTLRPIEHTSPEMAATYDNATCLGFIIPVAMQGTYPFIWDFFRKLPSVTSHLPCFLITTLASYSGGILGPVKKILEHKGYRAVAAHEIRMPNGFCRKEGHQDIDNHIYATAHAELVSFCEDLVHGYGKWEDIPFFSFIMSKFSKSKLLYRFYRAIFSFRILSERCDGCHLCIKLCPVHNLHIIPTQKEPVAGDQCQLCQRCFAYCPQNAIQYQHSYYLQYHAVDVKKMTKHLFHL